jgi:endonuclease/exonuclease/phosphatase family metal-dependent hydrolase
MNVRSLAWGVGVVLAACQCGPGLDANVAPATARPAAAVAPAIQASGGAAPVPASVSLRVATWNLEWLNRSNHRGVVQREEADYERLARYARRLDADIVAVQEVDGVAALRRVFDEAEYDYQVARQNGIQLTGFAYRKRLNVTRNPDLDALDVGGVRTGTDLSINLGGQNLRLLNVHLKSGCFKGALTGAGTACSKLNAQLPKLEAWVAARSQAHEAFLILGDFNRRLKTGEAFYSELDTPLSPASDLELVTDGRKSACWNGLYPQFIDHILLSRASAAWLKPGSFSQLVYDQGDLPFKSKLSGHCPVSIVLEPSPGGGSPAAQAQQPAPAPPAAAPGSVAAPATAVATSTTDAALIKGNINATGKKLYHLPSCPTYTATRIDVSRGERLFRSEAEAIAAGWSKVGNCP